MKMIQQLVCSIASGDDFAKEAQFGGVFNEIKDHNINPDILKHPLKTNCSGLLYVLDKVYSHKDIWGLTKTKNLRRVFCKDDALMLLNKAATFIGVENREMFVYLQDQQYYLVAESFIRKKDEGLIRRILLCNIKPDYQHRAGTGIIVA